MKQGVPFACASSTEYSDRTDLGKKIKNKKIVFQKKVRKRISFLTALPVINFASDFDKNARVVGYNSLKSI